MLSLHLPKSSSLTVLRMSFVAWLAIGLFFILAALSWLFAP